MQKFKTIKVDDDTLRIISQGENENSIELSDQQSILVNKDLSENKVVLYNITNKMISVKKADDDNLGFSGVKKEVYLNLKEKFLKFNDIETMTDTILYVDALLTLADAGYFITDQNREEKYIEIIETEDENLIELLETYLNIKDDIAKIKFNKKQFKINIDKLKSLDENSKEFLDFQNSL